MNSYFYDSRFEIEKINYSNILKDFNIYKLNINLKDFNNKDRKQVNRSQFFRKIKSLKNLKSFYIGEGLFLLGNKDFKVENYMFDESFINGDIQEITREYELEKLNKLTILNHLTKSIPTRVFENNSEKDVKYVDSRYLYLFIKEKKNKIFKFFKCRFEKDKLSEKDEYYILNLTQTTFAPEELFWNKKILEKAIKIGFDIGTRVLVPNENGKYYERNPFNRTVESNFLINSPQKIKELRSYYFTLIKDIVEEFLSEYIVLKFNTLENYEYFPTKSNKAYFKSKIKGINKIINVYRIKDIRRTSDGEEEIIAKDDFGELKEYLKSLKFDGIELVDKRIASIDTVYNDDGGWNIFLLNTPTGKDLITGKTLLYDTYKKVKENYNIISNGLYLGEISLGLTSKEKENGKKAVIVRVVEELFLKEAIKNRDISNLHSKYNIFTGVTCIQYCDKRIKKITILENGQIKIESSKHFTEDKLNFEFDSLVKKFNLEEKIKKDYEKEENKITTLNLKFIKINNKDIYIKETGMRVYFDSNEYIKQYYDDREKYGIKNIRKGLEGFLGMSMAIRVNRKENMYYSFYDTGIRLKESFSPNIKKLICKEELTEEDYSIFCESLVFKYLSNGSRLGTYPFFFKLTNEILKDCNDL